MRTEFQKYSVINTRLTFFKDIPSAPDCVIIITLTSFPYLCSSPSPLFGKLLLIVSGRFAKSPLNRFINILVFSLSELNITYLLLSYFSSNTSGSSNIYPYSSFFITLISTYPCLFRTSLNIPKPSTTRNCEYTRTLPGDVFTSSNICANFGL